MSALRRLVAWLRWLGCDAEAERRDAVAFAEYVARAREGVRS